MARAVGKAAASSMCVALALLLLAGAVELAGRTTEAERQALAMIDAPPPVHAAQEANGFPDLYTLTHDVPAELRGAVVAADAILLALWQVKPEATSGGWVSVRSHWPALVSEGDRWDGACGRERSCLEEARQAPGLTAERIGERAQVLARVRALSQFGRFQSPFSDTGVLGLERYEPLLWGRIEPALTFVTGRTGEAIAGICGRLVSARQLLASGTGSMVGAAVVAAQVRSDAALLAEMLAQMPLDSALDQGCQPLVQAPELGEGYCQAMLAEGRSIVTALRGLSIAAGLGQHGQGTGMPRGAAMFYRPERTVARIAPAYAWACSAQLQEAIRTDTDAPPLPSPAWEGARWSPPCLSNAVGCMLAQNATPRQDAYLGPIQDAHAVLSVTAALLAARIRHQRLDAGTLDEYRRALSLHMREPGFDAAGTHLHLAMGRYRPEGQAPAPWTIPLPGTGAQPGATP